MNTSSLGNRTVKDLEVDPVQTTELKGRRAVDSDINTPAGGLYVLEYSENGTDGSETIDVGRTVQRVETHYVFSPFFSLNLAE